MKSLRNILLVLMLSGALFQTVVPAEENQRDAKLIGWAMKPMEKLGRGLANVALGPLEIVFKTWDMTQKKGGVAGFFAGPFCGLAYFLAREVVGVIDIVTFPFPLPDCPDTPEGFGSGYGPIMYPAWVIDVEHDWWGFAYDRNAIPARNY